MRTVVDEYKLQTELRRENVTVDVDDSVALHDDTARSSGLDEGTTSTSADGHGEDGTSATRQP